MTSSIRSWKDQASLTRTGLDSLRAFKPTLVVPCHTTAEYNNRCWADWHRLDSLSLALPQALRDDIFGKTQRSLVFAFSLHRDLHGAHDALLRLSRLGVFLRVDISERDSVIFGR